MDIAIIKATSSDYPEIAAMAGELLDEIMQTIGVQALALNSAPMT